jgi:hypothetical protein
MEQRERERERDTERERGREGKQHEVFYSVAVECGVLLLLLTCLMGSAL